MSPPRPPPKAAVEPGTEIGTLVVVVDRAVSFSTRRFIADGFVQRNLVDKQRIGKQSPYVTLRIPSSPVPTKRTQTINRGGQAPEWDAELRFPIMSELEDTLGVKSNNGKSMTVVCWADDSREPTKVGEAFVDLTRSLTKGEDDLWVPLTLDSKDGGKYRGEVRLELTFFSNASPPPKKYPTRPPVQTVATPTKPPQKRHPRMSAPGPGAGAKLAHPASLRPAHPPQSLRGRQSLSNISLYRPDYMDGGVERIPGNDIRVPGNEIRIPSPLPSPQPQHMAYQPPVSPGPGVAGIGAGMGNAMGRQPSPNPYMMQQQAAYQEDPVVYQEQPQQPVYQVSPGHSPIPQVTPVPPPRTSPIPPVAQVQVGQPVGNSPPVYNAYTPQQVSQPPGQSPVYAQFGGMQGPQMPIAQTAAVPTPPHNGWTQWQNPADVQYGQQGPPQYGQTPPQGQQFGQTPQFAQTPLGFAQPPPPAQAPQPTQSRPLPNAPVIQSPFPTYPPPPPTMAYPMHPQSTAQQPMPPQQPMPSQQPPHMYPNYPPPPISSIYNGFGSPPAPPIQTHPNQHIQQ
ncbi:hypothetical protein E3Q08_00346 [Wallemia mellicola]|nr:hypothetical protein E3Q08_00346 [Wallemia mellicola]